MFSPLVFTDLMSFKRTPSVYVVSDSQLAEWKRQQALKEIEQLDRLIDGHKQSIERLEETKSRILPTSLAPDLPQGSDSAGSTSDPASDPSGDS